MFSYSFSNVLSADANKRGDDEAARKAATAAAEAQRQQTSASEPAVSTPQTVSTTPAATRDVSASSSVCYCCEIPVFLLA